MFCKPPLTPPKDGKWAFFFTPPSMEILHNRLINSGTDSPEMIEKRIGKADYEMTFAPQFDIVVVNDDLENAKIEAENVFREFLKK